MYIALTLVFFALWCLATAWRVQRELRSRPRPEPDVVLPLDPAPPCASQALRVPAGVESTDPESDTEPGLRCEPTGEQRSMVTVRILRHELGGGTTLAAVVRWDGICVRWELVAISPEWHRELQRLVLEETGLWPGHGLQYLQGLVATLNDREGRSRWRARWAQRGAA